MPVDGYWDAISEICRRDDILIIADEVMTGFGRTGEWCACDHFGLRPDILVAAKGASSGYWPLGLAISSGEVHDTKLRGRRSWCTGSPGRPPGRSLGRPRCARPRQASPDRASEVQGQRILGGLRSALGHHPRVGDVRGVGLLACVELVADRESREPFPDRLRSPRQCSPGPESLACFCIHPQATSTATMATTSSLAPR